jgi:hypothetical protein
LEDIFFVLGYSIDVLHMSLIEVRYDREHDGHLYIFTYAHSYHWGLGRHFFYLTPQERQQAMRFDFASQPVGMLSFSFSLEY